MILSPFKFIVCIVPVHISYFPNIYTSKCKFLRNTFLIYYGYFTYAKMSILLALDGSLRHEKNSELKVDSNRIHKISSGLQKISVDYTHSLSYITYRTLHHIFAHFKINPNFILRL